MMPGRKALIAHACFTASLKGVRLTTAGITAALEPVYGIMFAAILLREVPSAKTLLGGLMIIGAAVLPTLMSTGDKSPVVTQKSLAS